MFDRLKNSNSILLACIDVDKLKRQIDISQMASTLSETEHVRANAFRDALLKDRFIAGRFCLRQILGDELNMSSSEISFSIENNGKPVVSNSPTGGGHFSFSRSQQYVLIGYSASHRIGVDIERVRSFPDMELMAAEIFAEHQFLEWQSLPLAERPLGFFRGWTRKEAAVKVDGRGISDGVRQIDVPLGDMADQVAKVPLPHGAPVAQDVATTVSLTEWQMNDELSTSVAIESCSVGLPTAFTDASEQRFGISYGTAIRRSFCLAH